MLAPVAASLGAALVLWAQANSLPFLATAAQLVLPLMGSALMIAALMANRRMLTFWRQQRKLRTQHLTSMLPGAAKPAIHCAEVEDR